MIRERERLMKMSQVSSNAPSYDFLFPDPNESFHPTILNHNGIAFLGAETGFLPPTPFPPIPPPYSQWAHAAFQLPNACKSDNWDEFLQQLPKQSLQHIPDEHLIRANLYVGSIAHCLKNIANVPIPEFIMKEWMYLARRLNRPTASLTMFDYAILNYQIIPERFFTPTRNVCIADPWSQCAPHMTIMGSMSEYHFILMVTSISHAARPLPGVIARAQQAVVCKDNESLSNALIDIISIIQQMTSAFLSFDSRPLSRTYADAIEWSWTIRDCAMPVVPNERTFSGLLEPAIHLLDVFFSRLEYGSEMGKQAILERSWMPPLHNNFFDAVSKISVYDYIKSLGDVDQHNHLTCLYRRALFSFAHESGFLGRHRLRMAGLLELSMKIGGRSITSTVKAPPWESRPWRKIQKFLVAGMNERLKFCQERYHSTTVELCAPLVGGNNNTTTLVLNTGGAMVYQPGDIIEILSENSDDLVQATLQVLDLEPDNILTVTNKAWIQSLLDRDCDMEHYQDMEKVKVTAEKFLRIACLQPLDRRLGSILAEKFNCINPAIESYLQNEKACNVPIALHILKATGVVSIESFLSEIDQVLQPLAPRKYSIASNMKSTPNSVEIVIGKVIYEAQTKLPFKYGHPPGQEAASLALQRDEYSSNRYLQKYCNVEYDSDSDQLVGSSGTETNFNSSLIPPNIEKLCSILSNHDHRKGFQTPVKSLFRSQVLLWNARRSDLLAQTLTGISSTYLSRLQLGTSVRARVVPELQFHLPADRNIPIVMIALGTGMAPFRSFMKELIHEKHKYGHAERKAWLILGIQKRDHIPFLSDIEEAVCKEQVLDFSIAVSREDFTLDKSKSSTSLNFQPGSRRRIQGLFEQDPVATEKLWKIISGNGHIYTCGQPMLERIVRETIAFSVKRFASTIWNLTYFDTAHNIDSLADQFADRMAANNRLHISCYDSGKPAVLKRSIRASEVAEHRTASTCWSIFRDSVYDITKYLVVHPGGPKILLDKAGRDMTSDFFIAHGHDNLRVASMFEPYCIGSLEVYAKGSARIKKFMNDWSAPLLDIVLEHRSVALLYLNEFPDIDEPESVISWRRENIAAIRCNNFCEKIRQQLEVDLFNRIEDSLSAEKLGKSISTMCDEVGKHMNYTTLQETVSDIRENVMSRVKHDDVAGKLMSGKGYSDSSMVYINKYFEFIENCVDVFIRIQRLVEDAVEQSTVLSCTDDIIKGLIESVLKELCEGLSRAYETFPTDA